MAAVERDGELVLTRGVRASVFDSEGNEYLDLTAGLWFANVGHGRTEIADAMGAQAGRLAAYSTFGDMANEPVLELADRLAAIAPVPDSKVFFTSGGSDAVDTAAKLVRRYWSLRGQPQRTTIITRERAYHGMHWGGTAHGRHRAQPSGVRGVGRRRRARGVGLDRRPGAGDRRAGRRHAWRPSSASR